ncbi:hypothetical protein [Acinetobacter phage Abp95]|nr:hypothetical protein [Acinetobacter phage Abp95]
MILVKALWLAIVDVAKLFKHAPKLLVELFWALAGVLSLILSVVLFPLIVVRKYKELKPKKSKKIVRKFGVVRA